MTPVEKIIIRFYAANTFMFNKEDDNHYIISEKEKVLSQIRAAAMAEQAFYLSDDEIKKKYRYLRDILVKADTLIETNQKLTYLQKCVYQRMFYLKPFITKKHNNQSNTAGQYEIQSKMKTKQKASSACNEEIAQYLNNTKSQRINGSVNILNDKILAYQDTRAQRLRFYVILKAIRLFKESVL